MNVVLWFIVISTLGGCAQTKDQISNSTEKNFNYAPTDYSFQETTDTIYITSAAIGTENAVSYDDVQITTHNNENNKNVLNTTSAFEDDNYIKSTEIFPELKNEFKSSTFTDFTSEENQATTSLVSRNFEENDIKAIDPLFSILSNPFDNEKSTTESNCTNIPTIDPSTFTIEAFSFNVTLTWEAPENEECIEFYLVYLDQEYNTTETTITLENLNACYQYDVAVAAANSNDIGDNTTLTFNTTIPDDFNTYGVQNLTAEKFDDDSILITWTKPKNEVLECVTNYYFQWYDTDNNNVIEETKPDASETSYTIPLIGCMNSTIQIKPQAGQSNDGQIQIMYFDAEPRAFSKPTIINQPNPDKTEVSVTLQSDNATTNKCQIKEISISCEAPEDINSNFSWIIRNVTKDQQITETTPNFRYTVKIDGFSPFTNYTCNAVITNTEGPSEEQDFNFQTKEAVPSKPRELQINNVNSNNFTIKWREPEIIQGIMTHYNLIVHNDGPQHTIQPDCINNTFANQTFTINSEDSSYVFENAAPHYNYSVTLYGVDGAGNGEAITEHIITAASVPEKVLNATMYNPVYSKNETYSGLVQVTFGPPCNTNGPFKSYKINYMGTRRGFETINGSISTKNTSVSVSLHPDREYSINIEVVTVNFTSAAVSIPDFHSRPGVPFLSQNISAPSTNASSIAYFTLKKNSFSNHNGDIIAYCLILLNSEEVPVFGFWNGTNETWPPLPKNSRQLTPNFWNPFQGDVETFNFIIGNNDNCSENYCNKALNEDTKYWLLVRALTSAAYKDTRLYFHTEMLEELDLGLILGLTFGLLAIVSIIIFLVLLWRRKRQLEIPEETKRISTSPEAIPVQKFLQYYAGIKENYNIIKEQYSELGNKSKEVAGEVSFALLPENRRKNRYTNILPYDSTRVSLKIDEDDEICSDYINASYIKGYSGKIEYIATQGPLESTARDFWKMIIQENVSIIVMVSQFVEQSKVKCYQYFPNNHEKALFGEDLEVKCSTELHFGTYCVRTLQIRKNTEQRDVVHMQFLEWPDFGVPQGTDNMLQFCNQLREKIIKEGGLIVVHCSAGVGRTGTLIALDILLQTINDHRDINIYKTVFDLRKQRTNMVQTEKQYMFIHSCIKDYIEAPPNQTNVSVDNGERQYENLDVLRSSLKKNLIQNEVESAL